MLLRRPFVTSLVCLVRLCQGASGFQLSNSLLDNLFRALRRGLVWQSLRLRRCVLMRKAPRRRGFCLAASARFGTCQRITRLSVDEEIQPGNPFRPFLR